MPRKWAAPKRTPNQAASPTVDSSDRDTPTALQVAIEMDIMAYGEGNTPYGAQERHLGFYESASLLRKADPSLPLLPVPETDPARGLYILQQWCIQADTPAVKVTADRKEQPWADDAPEYLPLKEARKLIDDRVILPTLSKLMTPDGEMRYMRKPGVGCKVHLADFRRYMQGRQSDPKWAAAYMNWLQGHKAGKMRLFWKCGKCGLDYPDEARATDRCPQCKSQSALTPKAPPKPRK